MYFFQKILEFIFLPSCGICGKIGKGYLCKQCEIELKKHTMPGKRQKFYLQDRIKEHDKNRLENVEIVHIFKYDELIRKLILRYKFNDKAYLYKTFCEFIVKEEKVVDFIKSYDIIIPVPIHKLRMRERGYNQSELIADELSKIVKIDFSSNVLIKIKNNKVQSKLNKKEREENTKNVYKTINAEKIYNKRILILDDVYTTGATIDSCIEEIKKGKPSQIGVLTLAKD